MQKYLTMALLYTTVSFGAHSATDVSVQKPQQYVPLLIRGRHSNDLWAFTSIEDERWITRCRISAIQLLKGEDKWNPEKESAGIKPTRPSLQCIGSNPCLSILASHQMVHGEGDVVEAQLEQSIMNDIEPVLTYPEPRGGYRGKSAGRGYFSRGRYHKKRYIPGRHGYANDETGC